MEMTSKQRNQSQCREWERQRRNKFNDAITKLGEIVMALSKTNDVPGKESTREKSENVKYPKVEIVQKAIICLTNSSIEKTQLKAKILALQVKLDKMKERKDASTQVNMEIKKKSKSGSKVKLNEKKTIPHAYLKVKVFPTIPDAVNNGNKPEVNGKDKQQKAPAPKLPTLLPRCNVFDKKAPENTFVVVPATPYIFPQRPFLLPSMPPAIVVVDHNLQAVNKAVPFGSRNGGDITKTTMVNILPLSAYSRPLSVNRPKKSNVRLKSEAKKATKEAKPSAKKKDMVQNNEILKSKSDGLQTKENKTTKLANEENANSKVMEIVPVTTTEPSKSSLVIPAPAEKEIAKDTPSTKTNIEAVDKSSSLSKETKPPKTTDSTKTIIDNTANIKTVLSTNTIAKSELKEISKSEEVDKTSNKIVLEKEIRPQEKEKETKLTNILETTLDNVVDGGNARLELAEEFLAASPTAAFLMSFPLVSGNRADSPAEEPQTTVLSNPKDITQKRSEILSQQPSTSAMFYEKTNNDDIKTKTNKTVISSVASKQNEQPKFTSNVSKSVEPKISTAVSACSVSIENPFLNLPMPSLPLPACTLSDTTFGLDFESTLSKPTTSQAVGYTANSNIFYKNDPFSTAKSTIYSTSSISSNHDFNGIGLYPCAMEKYASKNKPDFTNLDDNNVMKIGSSRLTYDIDLGWSHKSFDFVSCTSNTTFGKDNITTVTSSTPFCTSSYNPYNPEFHVPLVSTSNKKDSVTNKTNSSFADTLTSFYSQHNLWSEEPFYNNSNVSKNLPTKHQNYSLPSENVQGIPNVKTNSTKSYDVKSNSEAIVDNRVKPTNNAMAHQTNEKYTKKSPSKMHINWMTSEIRPMQPAYNPMHTEMKESHKIAYNHLDHTTKRNDHNETNNFFPISMHSFPTQPVQEEFQVWPSTRPLGTTEISIDPPPINLPTLVGDLALGPHDKKKTLDPTARIPQQDLQNCSNFFSVTQLMNRSNDNVAARYQPTQIESSKPIVTKHNISHYSNDSNRKAMPSRIENQAPQTYIFNNPKLTHSYDNMAQFSQNKPKNTNKPDKNTQKSTHKNNYSAEALLRGGSCTQKLQESNKFLMPPQKYNDFHTTQDSSVAQVSHFPPIIDYSDNSYTGQQLSGTSLYNATTNTLSNSFYYNYSSGPFPGELIDYNQSSECNFANHKYEELKMRNNPPLVHADKMSSNYKSSRRESAAKHKLECSKKESSKKYQSKRTKPNNDVEEWSEPSHPLWQNKPNKRHPNFMTEELPFPNYVSNQMHSQYQPDFLNSHLMPSNMQTVGPNVDRSISSTPITSRANFNLSTIFPEITMKVQ